MISTERPAKFQIKGFLSPAATESSNHKKKEGEKKKNFWHLKKPHKGRKKKGILADFVCALEAELISCLIVDRFVAVDLICATPNV